MEEGEGEFGGVKGERGRGKEGMRRDLPRAS